MADEKHSGIGMNEIPCRNIRQGPSCEIGLTPHWDCIGCGRYDPNPYADLETYKTWNVLRWGVVPPDDPQLTMAITE